MTSIFLQTDLIGNPSKQELLKQIIELKEQIENLQISFVVIVFFISISTFLIGYWTKKNELLLKDIKKANQL